MAGARGTWHGEKPRYVRNQGYIAHRRSDVHAELPLAHRKCSTRRHSRLPIGCPWTRQSCHTRARGLSRHGSIHVGRFRSTWAPSFWEHPLPELAQEGAAVSPSAVMSTRVAAVGACLTDAARGRGAPLHASAQHDVTDAARGRGAPLHASAQHDVTHAALGRRAGLERAAA